MVEVLWCDQMRFVMVWFVRTDVVSRNASRGGVVCVIPLVVVWYV